MTNRRRLGDFKSGQKDYKSGRDFKSGQREYKSGQRLQFVARGISNRGRDCKSGQALQVGAEEKST